MAGIILSCSCTVLTEARCLCQIPSSPIMASIPSQLVQGIPCLYLLGLALQVGFYAYLAFTGTWRSRLQSSHLQVSALTAKPSLQPSSS